MKYARCPNCKGRLGIPSKKRGLAVTCPKCSTEFVAPTKFNDKVDAQDLAAPATPAKNGAAQSKSSEGKPKLRALPVPAAIGAKSPSSEMKAKATDPMMPPGFAESASKGNLESIAPKRSSGAPAIPEPPKRRGRSGSESTEVEVAATVEAVPSPNEKQPKRSVAKIVQTEAIQPQLSKDGTLPTLKLNDDVDENPVEEKRLKPGILALIICSSLLTSGLVLLMFGQEPDQKQERIEKTREVIRNYYQIRPDEELKPYQIDLRQAQLAHSRGDYRTEIRAYETIMARFRSEDLSEFAGLTGSPTADVELQQCVSTLLSEAKRLAE